MGTKLNGKILAEKYKEEIKQFVEKKLVAGDNPPCLANILVGNDSGSTYYVKSQNKLCSQLGIKVKSLYLDENITQDELLQIIEELNNNEEVNGIILQLPLPTHIDESYVTSQIVYYKDIDGLSTSSIGKLYKGEKCFIPCTPKGIIKLLQDYNIEIEGKNVVVIGRSNIVGKPIAQLLLNENATVTICHSKTKDLKSVCNKADILIVAMGKPGFVNEDYIKEDSIIIDVGTTMVNDKIKGDVDFDAVIDKAKFVTPVPGGVGAMTTVMLLKNLCEGLK